MSNRWKWPWQPFVIFALLCAWLPGFLFATFLGMAPALSVPAEAWYRALIHGHGHAMLMGWGGSMILGVALHFLPRLRGASLAASHLIPFGFWVFVAGTMARVVGPLLIALADQRGAIILGLAFHWAVAFGIVFQSAALVGILLVLAWTFRQGPPLAKKKGFRQIVPALAAAGLSAVLAQGAWIWAAFDRVTSGYALHLLPREPHHAAIDMFLFGGVPALSLGMSARLFPLTFRTHQAPRSLIATSASLLALGVIITAIRAVPMAHSPTTHRFDALAGLAFALGFLTAVPAVRVMHRRVRKTEAQRSYLLWRDPAGIGVVTAYGWALMAAFFLLLYAAMEIAGGGFGATVVVKDLARHAMGAGFMTILIVAVGWTMLPGFGGGTPSGRRWIWLAIALLNLAVFLRLTPGALSMLGQANLVGAIYTPAIAIAGLAGWVAIGAFIWALWLSRKGS